MSQEQASPDIAAHRLSEQAYEANFADLHPPLDPHEARVAADRCLFCCEAPCVAACPTSIDIPLFIRQISTGNPLASAKTILDANIMGGMCARVCPTETLCEQVCVREAAEGEPVEIGLLQRYATDALLATGRQLYRQGAPTGRRVAVVGAGPAGLACAHKLATLGHAVTLFEARDKPAGLNEYGIAAYKTPDDFAAREAAFILDVGGITLKTGVALGRDVTLASLRADHDAVFLGLGLGAVNALGLGGRGPVGRRGRGRVHRAAAPGGASGRHRDRPAHRRHRRRHDGDRHRDPDQAPRRRGGHHRVSPGRGADERLALRAGAGADRRRADPPLAAARGAARATAP